MLQENSVRLQKAEKLSEQVFTHIKRMILAEQIKGGEKIPEEKIAQTFGVSRTPIREALRKLEKYGLIKIVPHSHAEVVKVRIEDRAYIGEVRIQLEELSTRLLAQKASPEQCDFLSTVADECDSHAENKDIAGVFEKDSEFHLEIARMSGNPYIYEILRNLNIKILLLRTIYCTTLEKIRQDLEFHKKIVEAIRNHDVDKAVYLMTEHLKESYQ